MMDGEQRHLLTEIISGKVHLLVNELTADLLPEDDEDVRQRLTETFRFWREG
jgi:hypothetical protein